MPEPQYNPSDEEVIQIGNVMATLYAKEGSRAYMEGFRLEIIERFGLAGFEVHVDVHQTNVDGTYIPEVTVMGRCSPTAFDHERQQWAVQNNILGIDETPGAIQRDGSIKSPSKATSMASSSKMTASGLYLP